MFFRYILDDEIDAGGSFASTDGSFSKNDLHRETGIARSGGKPDPGHDHRGIFEVQIENRQSRSGE